MGALGRTLSYDEVEVGTELPTVDVPLTPTLIIATAIASRDYQDVHHDMDLAKQRGAKGIFMNILSTNGLVGRYVGDWAGPEAIFKRVNIRLGAPNYPGDKMVLTGRVQSKSIEAGQGIVDVEIRGANGLGDHVTGTVRVALPGAR
jgi:3-oxo-4,17-pregnadiene-20-carboxyl-CoA hydratase beta subunit